MRRTTGALLAAAALAGCSTSSEPAAPATTDNAHTRAVQIMQTVIPGATVAQAEDMMESTCALVGHDPTPAGVLATRANLVKRGLGTNAEVTAIIGASVAGACPEHLPALKGI
jgi:hypothetical protein